MAPDVIIVGAGLGGMSAGALLTHQGFRVLVLERSPVVGGRAMVVEQGGFLLNYGYHFVLGNRSTAVHKQILDRIGKSIPMNPSHIERFYQFRRGGVHPLAVTASSRLLPFASKLRYSMAGIRMMTAKPDRLANVPLGQYLQNTIADPLVRQYFLDFAQAVFFTSRPHEVSAGRMAAMVKAAAQTQKNPSLFPVGTWRSLFRALEERIVEGGGEIRCKAAVTRIDVEGGRAKAVWIDGERLEAKAIIVAVPPQQLDKLLPDGIPALESSRWASVEPTAGVSLDLGVEGQVTERIAALDIPERQTVLACHSIWDPSMAPQGHQLLQGIQFLTPAEVRDAAKVEAAKESLLASMAQFFPGSVERSVLKRFLIRPVLTSAWHRAGQADESGLIPVTNPAVPNLFFVGDGTAAAGELSTVACNSALTAAAATAAWLAGRPR